MYPTAHPTRPITSLFQRGKKKNGRSNTTPLHSLVSLLLFPSCGSLPPFLLSAQHPRHSTSRLLVSSSPRLLVSSSPRLLVSSSPLSSSTLPYFLLILLFAIPFSSFLLLPSAPLIRPRSPRPQLLLDTTAFHSSTLKFPIPLPCLCRHLSACLCIYLVLSSSPPPYSTSFVAVSQFRLRLRLHPPAPRSLTVHLVSLIALVFAASRLGPSCQSIKSFRRALCPTIFGPVQTLRIND